MTGAKPLSIPLIALNDILLPDYRATVIQRALSFRKQSASVARHHLDAALRTYVDLQVLDSQPTLDASVVARLVDACQGDTTLFQEVLVIWQQSHQSLARRMREFLRAKGLTTVDPEHVRGGFLGISSQEDMIRLVNEFHAQHPSFTNYDAALMLCCVHGYLPAGQAATPELPDMLAACDQIDTSQRTRWHTWLVEIRDLPLDAPEWDDPTARAFAAAVLHLADQRSRERQAIRARLQTVLGLLREHAGDTIDYFGFGGVKSWSDTAFDLAAIEPISEEVTSFYALLQAHRSSLQQAPASTRAEQARRRHEFDTLEATIEQAYLRLDAHFTPIAPVDDRAPEPLRERAVGAAPALPDHNDLMLEAVAPLPAAERREVPAAPPRRQGIFRRRAA